MSATSKKTDGKLWNKVKTAVTKGNKGGAPGQWSARKAQMAVAEYKKAGGRYEGRKSEDNHLQQWTEEDWGTRSGHQSGETGERYLPKQAREHLSKKDYARTTAKKRQDTQGGRQFSGQPKDVARKTKPYRSNGAASDKHPTRAELHSRAQAQNIAGRSRMTRGELEKALA